MNPGVELFESINVIVVSKGGTREPGEAKSSMRHNSTNKRLYKPNLSDIYDIETWSTSGQELEGTEDTVIHRDQLNLQAPNLLFISLMSDP